ncbi:MAG: phage polymerase-related protein [Gemmatimonadetes bacterium]|nr:phage polymerase-related protein [Gemmatimonadota bacterium]
MDGREALRRYLEQRRELGESELVLDSMTVDEALALLGAAQVRAPGSPTPSPRSAQREPPAAADWREAIRAAGGGPERSPQHSAPKQITPEEPMPKRDVAPKIDARPTSARDSVHVPDTQGADETTVSPLEDVPVGLTVGGASRALFDDPAAKLTSLAEIADAVAGCRRCPLYATAKNPVPGDGSSDADFMIVGEAPGANEDEQGIPFVGQAGQLLTKIIGAIDLRREDVFIANVLKHRPPGNRNPLPEEVTACSPYLVRQIELVRPKVILALGTFAAQTLLETKLTIGKLRGQIHRFYGVPLIVTYHPAALLRNPAWKRPTWEDVQLARRILDRARPTGA